MRQWVLSLPPRVRYFLACRHDLCTAVAGVLHRAVHRHLSAWAQRRGLGEARSGAVIVVQRFGGALNLNVHLHALVLDGVFARAADGRLRFHRAPAPTAADVADALAAIAPGVQRDWCGTVSTTTRRRARTASPTRRPCWRGWPPVCSPGASRWQPSINRRVARSASTPASRCGTNRSALNMLTGVKLRRCSRPQPDGDRTRMNPHKHEVETGVTMHRRQRRWWFALAVMALLTWAAPVAAAPYVYVLGKVPGLWQQYLTVIDAATNTTGPRIQLGRSNGTLLPHAIVMAPNGARVYVVNDYDQTISVVSTATNTVEDVWPTSLVGTAPRALAVSPDNQRLYVVGNHQLFIVIDIASRSRIATVAHNQGGALGIAVSSDGSRVYVMATGSNRVVVLGTAPYAVLSACR